MSAARRRKRYRPGQRHAACSSRNPARPDRKAARCPAPSEPHAGRLRLGEARATRWSSRSPSRRGGAIATLERLGAAALLLLPGAALVFFSFNAGGFFPGTPALGAIVLLLLLVARIVVVKDPFAGFSPALGVAGGALCLYAVWSLISADWSGSTWRALVEFDRALLYLLALVLYGSMPRDSERVRWMTRGVALGILVVCVCGLTTRLAPDVWPIAANLYENRLSYPITYWNSLGLLAAIGTILCFHFTCSRSEPRAVRVAAAGAVPILVTTLLLTFSRGAILTGAVGLLAYAVLGRPRALLTGTLATAPVAAGALFFSYRADEITGPEPTAAAAVSQGHDLALVIGISVVAALWLRWLFLPVDARIASVQVFDWPGRARLGVLAVTAAVVAVGLAVTLDAPGYVTDQYDRFTSDEVVGQRAEPRTRLTDPGNNGRIKLWKVAIEDGVEPAKLGGQGAGTFELLWTRNRSAEETRLTVEDAHSLYLESLSDLGLVGFLLVLTVVLTLLYGFAARLRGPNRTLYAALLGAALAWALHAGIDWDWEMPAVTLWLFALGGATLAAPARERRVERAPAPVLRAAVAGAIVLVGFVPALIVVSQGRLDAAVQAFLQRGDCDKAIEEARRSRSALSMRPDPYRLEGYCEARQGRTREAVDSMRKALDRDPDNWQYLYSLAVAQAAAGIDPRPAAKEALRLNSDGAATRDLVERFPTADPRLWREEAAALLEEPVF
jgi:O-antigen ligase